MTALHPLAWTASLPDAHAAIDRASALRDAGAPGLPEDPQVAAWLLAMFPDEAAARIAHALAHGAPHAAVAALAVASHFPPYHPACPPSPQAWRALREARVSVDAVEPALDAHRAALRWIAPHGPDPDEAAAWVTRWFDAPTPGLWIVLALPWVRDVETCELALLRWFDLAPSIAARLPEGLPSVCARLALYWDRAPDVALPLLRRIAPTLPRATHAALLHAIAHDAPSAAAPWMLDLATRDTATARAVVTRYATRNPSALRPLLVDEGRSPAAQRLRALRTWIDAQSADPLRALLGDGPDLDHARRLLAATTPAKPPPCHTPAGAALDGSVALTLLAALHEPDALVTARLCAAMAPTDLAALLAWSVPARATKPPLALAALTHLAHDEAVNLLVAWIPRFRWNADAGALLARVPRPAMAAAAVRLASTPAHRASALAAVQAWSTWNAVAALSLWAEGLPDAVHGRALQATLRDAVRAHDDDPARTVTAAKALALRPAWAAWASSVVDDHRASKSRRAQKERDVREAAVTASIAAASAFLRGRDPSRALVGEVFDLKDLVRRHFHQVWRPDEDPRGSRSVARTLDGVTLELFHAEDMDEASPRTPTPPWPVRIAAHDRIDPHDDRCLRMVGDALAARLTDP